MFHQKSHLVTPMITAASLLLSAFLAAPACAETPSHLAKWVSDGSELVENITGDLNRDGLDDVVLITEGTNSANIKQQDAQNLNLNPRSLIVLLKTSKGFKEVLNRDDLLPSEHSEDNPSLEDPLAEGGISINRGNLLVDLNYFQGVGGGNTQHDKFTFRFKDARFRLIGFDSSNVSRNSGETTDISINYLTSKKKISKGNIEDDSKPTVVWKKIPKQTFFLDEMSLTNHTAK